jgi:hypothetical protein
VLYLNRDEDATRRSHLLTALREAQLPGQPERVHAFAAWERMGETLTADAAAVIARIPRCTRLINSSDDGKTKGAYCTVSRPHCCFEDRWTGARPCEHRNLYAPSSTPPTWSHHACTGLIGHTLTYISALEAIAERHRSGAADELDGLVLLLEDDARPHKQWATQLVSFLHTQPAEGWELAKVHGGGPFVPDRAALRNKAKHGEDWWSSLPVRMWGTAAQLVHSSNARRIVDVLREQPLSALDSMLGFAYARGALTVALSADALFYPQPDLSKATTMEGAHS